ncbi:TetR/AcrR family transcriptional regulator [Microbacteriaceae bacterium VKM Ac-2854]|nr:TetR/AcrR family transcriptional regulator [Microbacteriaceae bacterium VKM Ac-2854]
MVERRSPTARAAILDAAFVLVGELGYARLSIEAIAARAGVGKQTIYRWWPSKGAVLFESILARSEPTGLPDTGDLEADLRAVLRATVAEFTDPVFEVPLRALTIAVLADERLADDYRERLEEPTRERGRERLRSAQLAGQLPAGLDLDVAVDAIFAPLAQRWLLRTGPLTPEYADALVATALRGLGGGSP